MLAVRARILAHATELIGTVGFEAFSMRRLARGVGMTVANIYNYYPNKNAIYLDIQTRGFEQLQRAFADVGRRSVDPTERVIGFGRAYIAFALANPDHYAVMLGSNTPKYADYVATEHEPLARRDKRAAVALIDVTASVLDELLPADGPEDARTSAIRLWAALHGVVSLANNRILAEVADDPSAIVEAVLAGLIRDITATGSAS